MLGTAESSRRWSKSQKSRGALYKLGAVPDWKFPDVQEEPRKEPPLLQRTSPEAFSKREPGMSSSGKCLEGKFANLLFPFPYKRNTKYRGSLMH